LRIAAIDIGTNSIHMVIARSTASAGFELADREREVVQIGRGSFESGRLRASAIRRTVEALARFVDLARRQQVDDILCTATAAVREAHNGGTFLEAAREASGITPRVIPPEEEGRLIYLAVKNSLQLGDRNSLIVDIGGGSAQLVVANGDHLIEARSAPLGALRLTESFLQSDPPKRRDLLRLQRHVRRTATESLAAVAALKPTRAYGSSGSIHALAELAHHDETGQSIAHLNGHLLTRDSLDRVLRRIQNLDRSAREKLHGIDPLRAEIIVPGAMVLARFLEVLGLDAITMSDFGVREGLVMDYLASNTREIHAIGDVEDLRMRSVLQLLQKFQPEERHLLHARHVARLSLALFDGLRTRHRQNAAARDLLHFSALLHDVGTAVGHDDHARHSSYLIRHGSLRGLSADEVEMIAIVARYHGKARPRKRDPEFRRLGRQQRRTVTWLAAMLRIAEGLDRSHYQLIQELRVRRTRNQVSLRLTARQGAGLEVWAARQRTRLLERLIGAPVPLSVHTAKRGASPRARPASPKQPGRRLNGASRPGSAAPGTKRPATAKPELDNVLA
jgi:exopolyphosphatase/guanosine-5'-triphosphate,3'-diphosphate pyrophosphatase